jgi:hypothetical protein
MWLARKLKEDFDIAMKDMENETLQEWADRSSI